PRRSTASWHHGVWLCHADLPIRRWEVHMGQPLDGGDEQSVAKRDRFAQFRGLRWWQLVLTLLPIGLVGIGGLVGGLIGGIGLVINLWLARRPIGTGLKVVAMVSVVIASFVVYLIFAGVIYALTH